MTPIPSPHVSPEQALKAYITGRWMLFTLLAALPSLFLSGVRSEAGILAFILLGLPAYTCFLGMKETRRQSHLTGDTGCALLWTTISSIIASCGISFGLSRVIDGQYPGIASIAGYATIAWVTISAVRGLEKAALVNPEAVDKRTRLAANVAAILTGTLILLLITSLLILLIALPLAMVILFFMAGDPKITLTILAGLPILTGILSLCIALLGRRRAYNDLNTLRNPVIRLKETFLYSLACSSFFIGISLIFVLTAAFHKAGEMINQYQ